MSLAQDLADILAPVQRPGSFCVHGVRTTPCPRLDVAGEGPLSLPVPPEQARRLVALAEQAPYGRGGETLLDPLVRRTWQIPAEKVTLSDWQDTLDAIKAAALAGLGLEGGARAELYKLLVYDEGSFFVEHRDTEKAPGMFATLIVVLPSFFEGGDLVVRHAGSETTLALGGGAPSRVAWAAFYADCLHELRPVVAGFRRVTGSGVLPGAAVAPAAQALVGRLPGEPARDAALRPWERTLAPPPELVVRLLRSLARIGDDALVDEAMEALLTRRETWPVRACLAPATLALAGDPVVREQAFYAELWELVTEDLAAATAHPPRAPQDWARPFEVRCRCAHRREATAFLASATEQSWTLRAVKDTRGHVEANLRDADVDMVTLRRGSPPRPLLHEEPEEPPAPGRAARDLVPPPRPLERRAADRLRKGDSLCPSPDSEMA